MTRHDTTTELKLLLNNGYNFTETKVLTLKKLLKESSFKEMTLNFLMDLDTTAYKSHNVKRTAYKTALKKIGFNIEKRKKTYLRKRIRKTYNTFSNIPDYVFKTFWVIKIQDE